MNTRDMTTEYRLAKWTQIIRERSESGLTVKSFCMNAGIRENTYFYWQKKLREKAIEGLVRIQAEATNLTPSGFMEVSLPTRPMLPTVASAHKSSICVETTGVRVTADSEYPISKLTELLRLLVRPC